jgi:hypothetical protein
MTLFVVGIIIGILLMLWVDRKIIRGVHRVLSRFL